MDDAEGTRQLEQTSRISLIRSAYDLFNAQDFDAVLDMMVDDVEWPDLIEGTVLKGKAAVRSYWEHQFSIATPAAKAQDLVEVGDTVVVIAYQELLDHRGGPLLAPGVVVARFSFCGELIAKMELTTLDDVPAVVRALFGGPR